jgi:GNAT superfamily N-acetyltransferase|tara:strand:+ start:60750 stop:61223 length:474 start_codon:yes stop_codon:yes gene_type:complete
MPDFESSRFADSEDYEEFVDLFIQSRQEASTYKASDIWLAIEALEGTPESIFENYLTDNQKAILIGEFNNVPVGFMLLNLFKLGEALAVRVDEVYVHTEVREVGVGERLMDSAIDWGERNGAVRILGRTFPGDRHMKNFYERFKVTARLIEVSKEIN